MKNKLYKIWKVLLPVLGCAGLIILLISVTKKQKEVTCSDVQIRLTPEEGNYFLDRQSVLKIAGDVQVAEELKGKHLPELNIFDMEMKLRSNVYVSEAFVTFGHDGVLRMTVTQKHPVFRVMPSQGKGYYVDKSGLKIPLSPNYTVRVPVVTGNIPETYEDTAFIRNEKLLEIQKIFNYIHGDLFWEAFIEQVHVDKFKGIILIPKAGSHTIVLGNSDDLEDKFSRLRIFYKNGLNKVGWEKYQQIDLSYKGQVVARKRNE
jgi:cell division protein FtsQ